MQAWIVDVWNLGTIPFFLKDNMLILFPFCCLVVSAVFSIFKEFVRIGS